MLRDRVLRGRTREPPQGIGIGQFRGPPDVGPTCESRRPSRPPTHKGNHQEPKEGVNGSNPSGDCRGRSTHDVHAGPLGRCRVVRMRFRMVSLLAGMCLLVPIQTAVARVNAATSLSTVSAGARVHNGLIALVHGGGLWTVAASGGSPRQIGQTGGCTYDLAASFSPDGQSLALSSLSESQLAGCPQTYPESTVELGIMRTDGSDARVVATIAKNPSSPIYFPTVEGPVFVPGGREFAYVYANLSSAGQSWLTEILLIDARTGRQRLVIPVSPHALLSVPEPSVPVPLAFSPDGTELAFVAPQSSRISIVHTSTGKPIRSIQVPTSGSGSPGVSGISWSTNGLIAFADTANSSIYTVRASGVGLRRMTQPPPGQSSASTETTTVDLAPEWSPNGASLLFDRQAQSTDLCSGCGGSETDHVEVMPALGGRPHLVWSGGTGSWSPDGKEIAVISSRGGAMNGVWIVGAEASSRKQIAGPTWVEGTSLSISWQSLASSAKVQAH